MKQKHLEIPLTP